jgi:uncharacterized protein
MTTALGSRTDEIRDDSIPAFVPHPLIRNGHEIDVDGGDRVLVFESVPENWRRGDPLALLVHGLAGCAAAPYLMRVATKLWRRGVRVVRMNLRGAGMGFGLARGIYHAGRTEDLRRVSEWMARQAPGSPLALVGFSLGANLALKLAAEASHVSLEGLDCVLAANPPIDLCVCSQTIQKPVNRLYDRNFVQQLRRDIARLHAAFPDLGPMNLPKVMTLYDFDDVYTAPRNGFAGAADYYARSSVAPRIGEIAVPGLVVHATDDPFIPVDPFLSVTFPPRLALELIPGGGHLGYLSHARWMGDRRWLDSRLTCWLAARWSLN